MSLCSQTFPSPAVFSFFPLCYGYVAKLFGSPFYELLVLFIRGCPHPHSNVAEHSPMQLYDKYLNVYLASLGSCLRCVDTLSDT